MRNRRRRQPFESGRYPETCLAALFEPDDLATEQAKSRLRKGIKSCRKIIMDYRTTLSSRPGQHDIGKKTKDGE